MDKPRFVLDSNVIIDHLNNQLNLSTFLDQFPLIAASAIILNATVLSNDPRLLNDPDMARRN